MEPPKTIDELIQNYERRSMGLRIMTLMACLLTIVAVLISIGLLLKNQDNIKRQGDRTQNYIRCIVLLPQPAYKNPDTRSKAVDECSIKSKIPK
jgi:hypothetical protein